MRIIDSDMHFMEPFTVYQDHLPRDRRDLAVRVECDDLGWPWLTHRGSRLYPIDLHVPGRVDLVGGRRAKQRAGEVAPPAESLGDACDPAARIATLDANGSDAALVFPNLGLLWEEALSGDPESQRANLEAYHTWLLEQMPATAGRLHPAAQLTLRDLDWTERELTRCARGGIRAAMIAAQPVDGRALAHPDFDRAWALCQDLDVAVCFHVSNIRLPLDPAWYALDPEPLNKVLDSTFLWLAPAVAVTSLIVHGKLEQFPRLRIGVVELSARWVPEYLLHLEGAFQFYRTQTGRPLTQLPLRPSEYFRRQVRVNALAPEGAALLIGAAGDLFMWGSDYPHAEGMARPDFREYERIQPKRLDAGARAALAGGNAAFLLGLRDAAAAC